LTCQTDQLPLNDDHAACLALEQLFGYMVRNGKTYGVLTTMKGWCFARREDGGRFYVTRMFGDFLPAERVSMGAVAEGYQPTTGFSIMMALYCLSALAESAADSPETPIGNVPGAVFLPGATGSTSATTLIQRSPPVGPRNVGESNDAECFQYDDDLVYEAFQFEPWLSETNLGPKTWTAIALPSRTNVVLKLWDAWHFDCELRNQEASIYLYLRSLWGKYIPSLRVKSPLDFFHALVLQYVKVLLPTPMV
jgi:hypothetical protein